MATRDPIPPEVIQKARRALELIRTRALALRAPPKSDAPPSLPTPSAPPEPTHNP